MSKAPWSLAESGAWLGAAIITEEQLKETVDKLKAYEIYHSGPTKASPDSFPTFPTYKCPDCYTEYLAAWKLGSHLLNVHGWSTSEAIEYLKHKYPEEYTKVKPTVAKEAHMPGTTTLTMDFDKLGKAKKQRDYMRNRLRTDIVKFADMYGCTQFEAAHAIMDTVLNDIDNQTKNYGTPAMPNALAQTLLPYTSNMVNGVAEPVLPENSTYAEAKYFNYPPTVTPKKKASKLPSKQVKQGAPEKLDKDVTDSDISAEIVFYTKKYDEALKKKKEFEALGEEGATYLWGYGYLYSNNKYIPGEYGSFTVIVKIRKKSPYISAGMLKTFDLKVPSKHFKFRKLKNKSIYKLQQYSGFEQKLHPLVSTGWTESTTATHPGNGIKATVQVSAPGTPKMTTYPMSTAATWTVLGSQHAWIKDALKNEAFVIDLGAGYSVSQMQASHSNLPVGWHWETCLTDPTKAVALPNNWGYDDYGKAKVSTPGAEFPYTGSALSWADEVPDYDLEDPEPWA